MGLEERSASRNFKLKAKNVFYFSLSEALLKRSAETARSALLFPLTVERSGEDIKELGN